MTKGRKLFLFRREHNLAEIERMISNLPANDCSNAALRWEMLICSYDEMGSRLLGLQDNHQAEHENNAANMLKFSNTSDVELWGFETVYTYFSFTDHSCVGSTSIHLNNYDTAQIDKVKTFVNLTVMKLREQYRMPYEKTKPMSERRRQIELQKLRARYMREAKSLRN
jgi:hypothetical protein